MPYCISSAVAIVPWSILFCYFGSLARNITEILEGKAGPSGKQSMLLLAVSGVVLVFVVVYSTIIARCGRCSILESDGFRMSITVSAKRCLGMHFSKGPFMLCFNLIS